MSRFLGPEFVRGAGGLLALALVLALPASAAASFPGRNGQVAAADRQTDRAGSTDALSLYSRRGGLIRQVASCGPNEGLPEAIRGCPADPAFSPSGSQLAFDVDGRLAVGSATGKGVRTLPRLTERDGDPHWSPSGDRLVFTGLRAGRVDLYLVRPDGTGLQRLTHAGGRAAAWSRRGTIAFVRRGAVYRLNPAHGGPRRVARGGYPDWSPSGRSLLYQRLGRTYLIATDRRRAHRRLVRRDALRPVFSPDGRRLLFLRVVPADRFSGDLSVYTAPLGGGAARVLIRGGELEAGSVFDSFRELAWQPIR